MAHHLIIWVRYTVLFSKFTSIPPPLKNSLAANLNSASTPCGEKNLTVGLDLVPLQSPKWINGFTLAQASWIVLDEMRLSTIVRDWEYACRLTNCNSLLLRYFYMLRLIFQPTLSMYDDIWGKSLKNLKKLIFFTNETAENFIPEQLYCPRLRGGIRHKNRRLIILLTSVRLSPAPKGLTKE